MSYLASTLYASFIQCSHFIYLNLYNVNIFHFCHILLFLYITGHFGSSIFISIDITMNIGIKIIIHIIHTNISNILFITFHQLSNGVFFISITGILFISERVVLVFVISNELVIYLYLIQKILVNSHKDFRSFFQ
ncbi:MAG: hypothetical protein Q8S84_00770 [bacterium]|nr:hypothetical protein [bacterium]